MVLSRPDILKYLKEGKLRFDPEIDCDAQVAQVSVDLYLSRKFTVLKDPPPYLTSIQVDHSLWDSADLWEHNESDVYVLEPKQFVLAQTLESVSMPPDLVGLVEGRSSWARVGVSIHITAPKIDPGFNGPITLEMANLGRVPVVLKAKVHKPAQLILLQVSTPLTEGELYGAGPHDAFQRQSEPIPRKKKRSN